MVKFLEIENSFIVFFHGIYFLFESFLYFLKALKGVFARIHKLLVQILFSCFELTQTWWISWWRCRPQSLLQNQSLFRCDWKTVVINLISWRSEIGRTVKVAVGWPRWCPWLFFTWDVCRYRILNVMFNVLLVGSCSWRHKT